MFLCMLRPVGLLLLFCTACERSLDTAAPAARWPVLVPIDTTFAIESPNTKVLVKLPLRDHRGKVAYTLACRGGGGEPFIADGPPDSLWIAGAFACRMNEGTTDDEHTILYRDEVSYWHTPGHFWYSAIANPDARSRVLRLRGFELVLSFDHVRVSRLGPEQYPWPERFDFHVVVRPDAKITTEWLEGTGVRMCRDLSHATRALAPCADQ